jgi:hypothetical protein
MNNRVNQQRNIGYILGVLDSDGCISLNKTGKTKTPPIFAKLLPNVSISNTSLKLIDKCVEILKENNIPFYIRTANRNIKHKPIYTIMISGLKRVKKFIEVCIDNDFAKKDRLLLLEEFVKLRLNSIDKHPANKPYSKRELEILNEIHILNEIGGKSRYIYKVLDPNKNSLERLEWKHTKMEELVNKGWTQKKIGNFFGIDQSSVSEWIKRNPINSQRLPSELQNVEGIV